MSGFALAPARSRRIDLSILIIVLVVALSLVVAALIIPQAISRASVPNQAAPPADVTKDAPLPVAVPGLTEDAAMPAAAPGLTEETRKEREKGFLKSGGRILPAGAASQESVQGTNDYACPGGKEC